MGTGTPLTEEELLEVAEAETRHRFHKDAADELGLDRRTFAYRLKLAAKRGLTSREPVMPGFQIDQVSTQKGADQKTQKEWIKQVPEREKYELPNGHVIQGVSALTDAGGNIIQQWVKSKLEGGADLRKALVEVFQDYKGHATLPTAPEQTNGDLLTVYPISDHHLGMYAWAEEAGDNYDLAIGSRLLLDAMTSLIAGAPHSRTGLVLGLGDLFHTDDDSSRTPRGTPLDVDSRHAKVLRVGVGLIIHCVQLALQKHERVILRFLPGNHDPYAAVALATGLFFFFSSNPRVTVNADPSVFFKYRFGQVLITATHGDRVKPIDLPGVVAATWPEDWGRTKHRYGYLGHVHHKSSGGERSGLIWETFQSLAPKDAWHYGQGYRSGRSMVAITHHHVRGEISRNTVSVDGGCHAASVDEKEEYKKSA